MKNNLEKDKELKNVVLSFIGNLNSNINNFINKSLNTNMKIIKKKVEDRYKYYYIDNLIYKVITRDYSIIIKSKLSINKNKSYCYNGFALFYDVTDKTILPNFEEWVKNILNNYYIDYPQQKCFLIVNNIDFGNNRVITKEKGENLAKIYIH